uniref:Uncharacterized protein n=1 Tax=Acidithiobacillus ferrooxidans TaxID=920 RepID=F1C988_ACIFR|nr:hypothetical protein [Acidithiobacillus ferrooxidans]
MGPTRVTVQASLPPNAQMMSSFNTIPQKRVKEKSTGSIQRVTRYDRSNPAKGLGRGPIPRAHQMNRLVQVSEGNSICSGVWRNTLILWFSISRIESIVCS